MAECLEKRHDKMYSPYYNVGYYSYSSIWPYYIAIH